MSTSLATFANDLLPLRQAMDRLLDEAFLGGPTRPLWSRAEAVARPMPLDVYATENEAVILAAVPGMRPEDLEITAHQNTVTLTGKVADVAASEEAKHATWYLHELWSGEFRRSVTLPFEIDAGRAAATFEQGIVRVTLPKAEQAKPKRIAIGGASAPVIGAHADEAGQGQVGTEPRS